MNSELFWAYKDEVEALGGHGFAFFSLPHILWLICIAIFVTVFSICYNRGGETRRDNMRKVIAVFLILFELYKQAANSLHGIPSGAYLPFEICSFAEFVVLFDALWPNNKILKQLLGIGFMPATFMAMMLPSCVDYPPFAFYAIHQFVMHAAAFTYIVARFSAKEISVRYIGIWQTVLFVNIAMIPVYFINKNFGTNYMFIMHHIDNPVFKTIWDITGGNGGFPYIIGLEIFCTIVFHIVYFAITLIKKLKADRGD